MKKLCLFFIFFNIIIFSTNIIAADKDVVLPREHIAKLKRIAGFFAAELKNKNIKTVTVGDFTDFNKKPSARGKTMAREFKKQLEKIGKKNFKVIDKNPEALITGILLPYQDKSKWQLDLKAVYANKEQVITAYTAIFKKPKQVAK
ncbi:MAG: hypothetical protein LLF28_02705 [Nitrospiraceae bacterium]|nr:hypothetical protein [Nitrospiraceae bacterium]